MTQRHSLGYVIEEKVLFSYVRLLLVCLSGCIFVSLTLEPYCKCSSSSTHCFSLEKLLFSASCFSQLLNSVLTTATLPLRTRWGKNVSRQSQSIVQQPAGKENQEYLCIHHFLFYLKDVVYCRRGSVRHTESLEVKGTMGLLREAHSSMWMKVEDR